MYCGLYNYIDLFRGAPDSDFYYSAGYWICRISKKNLARLSSWILDILFNLNTRMSSKKDQIHLSTSYICHM